MGSISRYKSAASRKIYNAVSGYYYDHLYGRKIPLDRHLINLVGKWERLRRSGDTPISQSDWDSQYSNGKWACLANLDELARYSVIVGYLRELKPGGSILDIGSGEGLLFERFRPYGYTRYVGVDLSSVAQANLRRYEDENTSFHCADAATYVPEVSFDVVVFNEILYYFHDPEAVFERYMDSLAPNGIAIVSTYTKTARGVAILRNLKACYPLLHETLITHGEKSWTCSVFISNSPQAILDRPSGDSGV